MEKFSKFTRAEFLYIILPATLSIILFISSFYSIVLPSIKESIMDKKKEAIRNIIYATWNDMVYHNSLVENGTATLEEAQQEFIDHIKFIRYGEDMKDYIWINDLHPTMIVHPYRTDLNGKDLSNYMDPHGKKLFVESVKTVKAHDEGYIDYMWQWKDDSTRVVPKISFVKIFKPWGWIIGSGIYIDDVEAEIAAIQKRVLVFSAGILFLVLILQVFLIKQSINARMHREEAECQLRKSQRRFKNLANLLPQMIFEIDTQGYFTYANKFAFNFTGYTEKDIENKLHFSKLFNPEDNSRIAQRIKQIFKGVESENNEYKLVKKSGQSATVSVYTNPIFQNNIANGIRGIAIDITEKKRLQDLSGRAQRLEVAGRIAGQVAHDFNNLLGPLMAYPELIRKHIDDTNPARQYIDKIEMSAGNIAEINQQLLTLSRRGHYNLLPINLNDILNQVIESLKPIPEHILIKATLADNLMAIKGGAAQILRILQNLLSNAIESIPEAGIIRVVSENNYKDTIGGFNQKIPKGEYVKITISDTGPGIPENVLPRIFDPFFTTKISDKNKGSGLGLTVVHSIMEDHNGYVDLITDQGKGTTFILYFPITREQVIYETELEIVGGNESILVVDDDSIQRDVTSKLLDDLGYEVIAVDSGRKAIDLLQRESYDLLILDMIMPGDLNGTQTYRKAIEIRPGQKAIIVSGYSENDQVKEALELGVGSYIRKPLTLRSLAISVRNELDRVKKKSKEMIGT